MFSFPRSASWLLLLQRPRNPCRGLRTACDRRTRSEQLHGRGAAGPRAGDSREDRFEKSAFLVEHEQWRYCSIPAYARSASATTRCSFAHDFWRTLLRRVLGRPWLLAQHICDVGVKQRTFSGRCSADNRRDSIQWTHATYHCGSERNVPTHALNSCGAFKGK